MLVRTDELSLKTFVPALIQAYLTGQIELAPDHPGPPRQALNQAWQQHARQQTESATTMTVNDVLHSRAVA